MKKFNNKDVKLKFSQYPAHIGEKLLRLRELIYEVAEKTEGVGKIEECLKWGEPSFITLETKSGSTIRMDWKANNPTKYHLYFNCQTKLISIFKEIYPNDFDYGGSRSISILLDAKLPKKKLSKCLEIALTYNLKGHKDFFN